MALVVALWGGNDEPRRRGPGRACARRDPGCFTGDAPRRATSSWRWFGTTTFLVRRGMPSDPWPFSARRNYRDGARLQFGATSVRHHGRHSARKETWNSDVGFDRKVEAPVRVVDFSCRDRRVSAPANTTLRLSCGYYRLRTLHQGDPSTRPKQKTRLRSLPALKLGCNIGGSASNGVLSGGDRSSRAAEVGTCSFVGGCTARLVRENICNA